MRSSRKLCLIGTLLSCLCPSLIYASVSDILLSDGWRKVSGEHFSIISNAEPHVVRSITEDLERFRFYLPNIAPDLKINPLAPPLIIYVFKDRQSYALINQCDICTGFFIQTPWNNYIGVNLDGYHNDPDQINAARRYLYHEYIHYTVRNSEDRKHFPLWYEEGLAELLSTFLYNSDVIRVGVMRRDMWLIDFDDTFPVEEVLKRNTVPENNRQAAKYYNYALILYRYFMKGKQSRAGLRQYISLCDRGCRSIRHSNRPLAWVIKDSETIWTPTSGWSNAHTINPNSSTCTSN